MHEEEFKVELALVAAWMPRVYQHKKEKLLHRYLTALSMGGVEVVSITESSAAKVELHRRS